MENNKDSAFQMDSLKRLYVVVPPECEQLDEAEFATHSLKTYPVPPPPRQCNDKFIPTPPPSSTHCDFAKREPISLPNAEGNRRKPRPIPPQSIMDANPEELTHPSNPLNAKNTGLVITVYADDESDGDDCDDDYGAFGKITDSRGSLNGDSSGDDCDENHCDD
jgi:hypothetical protein